MKIFYLIIFLLLLLAPLTVYARSGCCSSHGGVCDCSCCDGTSLSATCAPYYPQCNGSAPDPISAPAPVRVQRQISAPIESSESKDYNWLGWVIGIGAVGGLGYFIGKNKK